MNFKIKRLKLYLLFLLLSIVTTVILRTLACVNELEYTYGYFNKKSLISTANIIVVICSVLLFCYVIFGDKRKLKASFSTPLTYVTTAAVGAGLFFLSIALVRYADSGSFYPLLSKETLSEPRLLLALLSSVLALFSCAHFFLNSFISNRISEKRAYFSLVTVSFLAFYAAMLYFMTETPINSVNKLTDQMAFLFSAIFFLYETRISLGTDKWRAYIVFGAIASLLCAYSSTPALLTYLIKGEIISASIEENAFVFCLFLFISARLILTAALPEACDACEVTIMDKLAKAREKSSCESKEATPESEEWQISITDLLGEDMSEESEIYTPAVYFEEGEEISPEPDPQQLTLDDIKQAEE